MKTFEITITKTLDATIVVEAETEDEAVNLVFDHNDFPGSLCHQCTGKANDGDWEVAIVNGEEYL